MNKEANNIGLIGRGVMGSSLAQNMADHSFSVAVFNRTAAKTDEFIAGSAAGKSVKACYSLIHCLDRPRTVMLMVEAGNPVDQTITQRKKYLGAHTYERIDEQGVFHTRWEE
jgi:6-phosphogluconate dehydrogenase